VLLDRGYGTTTWRVTLIVPRPSRGRRYCPAVPTDPEVPIDAEVLIVSYNSADVLEHCLASLDAILPGVPVRIREHGNDSAALDRLGSVVASHRGPVQIEHEPRNPGFAAGCNALAESSTAEWLMFLNPDTETLAFAPVDAGRPLIMGATFVDSGHAHDHAGRTYRLRDEIARSWLRRRGPRPDGRGFVSGAAMLIDRTSFEQLGGFDERYFMYYEDIDLCLRANAHGVPTMIDAGWRVRHARGHSTSQRFGPAIQTSYRSGSLFHSQHGTPIAAYRAYVVADSLLRALAGVLRRTGRAGAYLTLARRAALDLVTRQPVG
jgi:GT2 family glycosyltransferase